MFPTRSTDMAKDGRMKNIKKEKASKLLTRVEAAIVRVNRAIALYVPPQDAFALGVKAGMDMAKRRPH